ncbi:hypothetical protein HMPREF1982_00369 [Clostridiales bacterium oral taxon 876 str. F0540]|nr:hypothetical protein HMPREF1982_00369 [Clostridiales bacterium oral taxon 876 str. F0540]
MKDINKQQEVCNLIEEIIKTHEEQVNVLNEIINCQIANKPSLFERIFKRKFYKQYTLELKQYNTEKQKELAELFNSKNDLKNERKNLNGLQDHKNELLNLLAIQNKKLNKIITVKKKWQDKVKNLYPSQYWRMSTDDQQLNCLWITEELNNKRCELFLLALQLHKAFILNVGKAIKSNLSIFANYLSGDEIQGNYLDYISDLWNTLFLIVPVVSSPFASIGRMYKHLGKEEIGWLLIDEAGQALPQTAIGAIWRSKRVVVVGDPLQVEPVCTIALSLIEVIGKAWGVDDVVSKTLSVQVMADNINKYGTKRRSLWIGCPLLVHRRCEKPMFSISNKIAYNNKMIYGTKKYDIKISIEKNEWIDSEGKSKGGKSHYIVEQGEVVYDLIKKAITDNKLPELYVISPFTTVISGIKYRVKELIKEYNFIDEEMLEQWIKESIGTVHTFQGKETDIVIFCLGVDKEHEGAVNWASKSPNILNVAVTRAKVRIVIVGDKKLWGSKPHFKEALEFMSN